MNRRRLLAAAGASLLAGCSTATSDGHRETTVRSPETRLKLRSTANRTYDYSLRLVALDGGSVAFEKTVTLDPNESIRLDEAFERGESYRFVVARGGTELSNRTVHPHEGLYLTADGDGVEIAREVER